MEHRRILFPLLTLVLASLACDMSVGGPVSTVTPVLTRTPNATGTPLPTPSDTPNALGNAEVTAFEALHVRAEPSHQADVVDYLFVGEEVTLTGECQDGWAQIEWADGTAWVRAKFLSDNLCKESE